MANHVILYLMDPTAMGSIGAPSTLRGSTDTDQRWNDTEVAK